jgi:hypothetical protein
MLMAATASAQTKTAQSIMIDTSAVPTTLAIVQTQIYRFNVTDAAAFFTNESDGKVPTVSCTGNPTACSNPAPIEPPAPAPLASAVIGGGPGGNIGHDGIVGVNRCVFLDGGSLIGASYTQTADVEVGTGSSKRKYTYTYTYDVTPNSDSVGALTAWDLFQTSGDGSAHVDVVALIAGESVSVSKNLGTKYSFSLLQGDGVTVRVQDVSVSVDGGTPVLASYLDETLTYQDRNPAGLTRTLDYKYTANTTINGLPANGTATSSLLNDALASAILNGTAGNGANINVFPGNDNGGANGQALAAVRLSGIGTDPLPGEHTITITATVKDNSGVLIGNVGVTINVNVFTPGCGGGGSTQ